jgi:hypothetical protein
VLELGDHVAVEGGLEVEPDGLDVYDVIGHLPEKQTTVKSPPVCLWERWKSEENKQLYNHHLSVCGNTGNRRKRYILQGDVICPLTEINMKWHLKENTRL